MERLSYTDFSVGIHRRGMRDRVPLDGTIEVTHRCPLKCAHCYNNLPAADSVARAEELSTEEHCRILDEIAEAGCLWLLYTGGEIFARQDFLEIYRHGKSKGLIISLFTNGTLITPEIADFLADWRPFSIEITLYGRTRETFEALAGVRGSYDRCLRGIRLLLDRKLPLELKTVAVRLNKHEVLEMGRFAREELGVPFKFDGMLNARIDCSRSPLDMRLTPAEIVEFDLLDPARIESWKGFCDRFNGPVQEPGERDLLYHCGAGVGSFSIDPYGQLSLCVLSHRETYDLRKGRFLEGWEGFLRGVRYHRFVRPTKCVDCQIKAMCGMCPANGELECRDPEEPVDFLCHVAHLRSQVLGTPVPRHGDCEYCPGGPRYGALQRSLEAVQRGDLRRQMDAQSEPRKPAAGNPVPGVISWRPTTESPPGNTAMWLEGQAL